MTKEVWGRSFFPVLLTYFIDNFGLAIVYPIFTPLFLRPDASIFGISTSLLDRTFLLGLLIASFPLAQFVGAPFWGDLSDRMGRKKVFLVTITGGVAGYLLTGLGIHYKILTLLWSGRAMAGLFAGNLTLCLAAIADITEIKKKERSRNFGWVATVGGLGFVLAILTGGSLSNPDLGKFFRPEVPFFITAFLSLVNLGLMIKFFKESSKKRSDEIAFLKSLKNIKNALFQKQVRSIYLVYFLFMICWVSSMQFLSAYLIDVFNAGQNTITLTFVFVGITWALANFLINPILSGIFRPSKTFLMALTFLSIFLYLTLIPREPLFVFLIHFFIATLFAALSWTNGLAMISLNVSENIQGRVLGVNQSIVAIASIVGPICASLIAGIDIHKLYLFTASCGLSAALLLFIHAFGIRGR